MAQEQYLDLAGLQLFKKKNDLLYTTEADFQSEKIKINNKISSVQNSILTFNDLSAEEEKLAQIKSVIQQAQELVSKLPSEGTQYFPCREYTNFYEWMLDVNSYTKPPANSYSYDFGEDFGSYVSWTPRPSLFFAYVTEFDDYTQFYEYYPQLETYDVFTYETVRYNGVDVSMIIPQGSWGPLLRIIFLPICPLETSVVICENAEFLSRLELYGDII